MPTLFIHAVSNIVLILALAFYEKLRFKRMPNWKNISLLVFASQLIDFDHLLATPIYDPLRCSINFHPLHSWYMFPVYVAGVLFKKYSYFFIAIGLHLVLDYFDCMI